MKRLFILSALLFAHVGQASSTAGSLPAQVRGKMLQEIRSSCPEFSRQGYAFMDTMTFSRQEILDQNFSDRYYSTTFLAGYEGGPVLEEFVVEAISRGGQSSGDQNAIETKVIGCR